MHNHPFLGPLITNPVFRGALLRESAEEEVREFIRLTYGAVSLFDNAIGDILATLDKVGYAENTIVVYTSDHGDLMGDHGMIYKGPSPFDGVLRVPLIMGVPGLTKPGSVSNSLVSSIDFSKTILNLTNIPKRLHPPFIQGVDLTPVLEDPEAKVRDCCLIEEDEEVGPIEVRLRHLITETHKITIYAGLEDDGDIYDRKNDPDELNNLWDKDKELKERLFKKLSYEILKAQPKIPERQAATLFIDTIIKLQLWALPNYCLMAELPTYCIGANGVIILFDLTNKKTLANIKNWVKIIRKKSGNIPLLIIYAITILL